MTQQTKSISLWLLFVLLILTTVYLMIGCSPRSSNIANTTPTPESVPSLVATAFIPSPIPKISITISPTQLPSPKILTTPPTTLTSFINNDALPISYIVALGDSLNTIAIQFNTNIYAIAAYNQIDNLDSIREGQILLIPPLEYTPITDDTISNNLVSRTHQSEEPYISHVNILGNSVNGYPIRDYVFGQGDKHVVFVGGIHGGYEWNSILLAYEVIDYFLATPDIIPETITLHIIPVANPDGQFLATNTSSRFSVSDIYNDVDISRFNGNTVDLNRNWDCQWQSKSMWRNQIVSAGKSAFSEPETIALRSLFLKIKPVAAGFWHSQLGEIIASGCGELFLPTIELAETYAQGSLYPIQANFEAYLVTGDASDWLATIDIPAITIELTTHTDTEFNRNIAGVLAVLNAYSQ